ncbi:hypothetical protein PFISCL1PPCAC_28659, partial [Pristionchus fissidentatus]
SRNAAASSTAFAGSAPRGGSAPVRTSSSSGRSFGVSPLLGFGAGALAGSMTANRINNMYAPVHYGGNSYYWGRDVVPAQAALVCSRPLEDVPNYNFDEVMFTDGNRPTEFAWTCAAGEKCCDWTCCPDEGYGAAASAAAKRSAVLSSTDAPLTTASLDNESSNPSSNPAEPASNDLESAGDCDEDASCSSDVVLWVLVGLAAAVVLLLLCCTVGYCVMKKRKEQQPVRRVAYVNPVAEVNHVVDSNNEAWSAQLPAQSSPPRMPPPYPMAHGDSVSKPPAYSYPSTTLKM